MATGKSGARSVNMPKPSVSGPGGTGKGGPMADMSKGSLGMRQTYKQTGKPGKGNK